MAPPYSPHERQVLGNLDLRQLCIMNRLGGLIADQCLDEAKFNIPLEALEGAGYDGRDLEWLDFRLRGLIEAGILASFAINSGKGLVELEFERTCLGLVRHFVETAGPQDGLGAMRGAAMLALKRAFKIRSDVYYSQDFTTENFNWCEDTSYLDRAFDGHWRMDFSDHPDTFMRRLICVQPDGDSGNLHILQEIHYLLPGKLEMEYQKLCELPAEDFTNPAVFDKMIPQIQRKAEQGLAKARERLQAMQEVETDDGRVINKFELLESMRQACVKSGRLARLFNCDTPPRVLPEWPLDSEPHGYFREYSCDLASFRQKFAEKLQQYAAWDIKTFLGGMWLHILRERHDVQPEKMALEEYGEVHMADELREKHPDLAASIEAEYQQAMQEAQIRIAWGLSTTDFKGVEAFVDAVISHPKETEMRISHIGWNYTRNLSPATLLRYLDEAEKSAIRN